MFRARIVPTINVILSNGQEDLYQVRRNRPFRYSFRLAHERIKVLTKAFIRHALCLGSVLATRIANLFTGFYIRIHIGRRLNSAMAITRIGGDRASRLTCALCPSNRHRTLSYVDSSRFTTYVVSRRVFGLIFFFTREWCVFFAYPGLPPVFHASFPTGTHPSVLQSIPPPISNGVSISSRGPYNKNPPAIPSAPMSDNSNSIGPFSTNFTKGASKPIRSYNESTTKVPQSLLPREVIRSNSFFLRFSEFLAACGSAGGVPRRRILQSVFRRGFQKVVQATYAIPNVSIPPNRSPRRDESET